MGTEILPQTQPQRRVSFRSESVLELQQMAVRQIQNPGAPCPPTPAPKPSIYLEKELCNFYTFLLFPVYMFHVEEDFLEYLPSQP